MNNRTLSGELEIDLIQVIRDLLLQWKAIICVMLVCCVATAGIKYMRDVASYNSAVAEKNNIEEAIKAPQMETKIVYDGLTDEEITALESTVAKTKLLKTQEDFVSNSILMSLKPEEVHTLVIRYYLDTPDGSDLQALWHSYMDYIGSTDFLDSAAEEFNKYLDTKTEPKYVDGVFFSGNFDRTRSEEISSGVASGVASGETYVLTVYLPDSVDAADVEKFVRSKIEGCTEEFNKSIGEHTMEYLSSDEKYAFDQTLMDMQRTVIANLASTGSDVNTAVKAFSDKQKQIYDLMIAGGSAEVEEESSDTAAEAVLTVPSLSKKYALLGLLIGLVIYGGIYLLILIFIPVIRTGLELSDMLGIKSFGSLHSETKRMGFMCDRRVFNLLYHREKSVEELLSDVVERIGVFAKYHEIEEITLVSADAESAPMVARIKDELNKAGVAAAGIDLWDGEKLTDLAEESMSGNDNYIICMMPRATLIADIDKMLSVAGEYEKKIVGTVAL